MRRAASRRRFGIVRFAAKFRLAGSRGSGVQQKDMIQNAHQHLQLFGLAAPELLGFQSESAFSLSFIFCMNSENSRTSPAILSDISFAPAEVFFGLHLRFVHSAVLRR